MQYEVELGGRRRRRRDRAAAARGADAWQGRPGAREAGRSGVPASSRRGRRSDEDGERAARQPRRNRHRGPRSRGDLGRRRRAAHRHPVKFFPRLRGRTLVRYVSFAFMLVVALLAAAIVASVTIDLGPAVRQRAERAGSDYIERPMHIGSLKIRLLTGDVVVEDLTIDGLHEGDRPFFTARRLAVSMDWLPAFARRPDITISAVEMTDWHMLVEKWESAHNFPRFNHNDGKPPGPQRV